MANRQKIAEAHGWDPDADPLAPPEPPEIPESVDMTPVVMSCDDHLHMSSCIVAHPRYDGPESGIGCWYLGMHLQALGDDGPMFALYGHHIDEMIEALTQMRARMKATGQ